MLALFCTFWVLMDSTGLAGRIPEPEVPQVRMINREIEQQWQDYGLKPAEDEQDGKWCRRLFLDLIGRVPTVEELVAFERSREPNKRELMVEALLNDSRYTEEFALHWGSTWSNILIGRSGGMDRDSFISRDGMGKYLRDCFARNVPYDKMVYELITATGAT